MRKLIAAACIAVIGASALYAYTQASAWYRTTDHYAERQWQAWYDEQFFQGMVDACIEDGRTGTHAKGRTDSLCRAMLDGMPDRP